MLCIHVSGALDLYKMSFQDKCHKYHGIILSLSIIIVIIEKYYHEWNRVYYLCFVSKIALL